MTSPAMTATADPAALKTRIAAELEAVRRRSLALTDPLDDDDLRRQHSPLMSPLIWDLAHVGNYEELWLLRGVAGIEPLRPEIDDIYDAFVTPRADRPALPVLPPAEARAYLAGVRAHALDVLDRTDLDATELTAGGMVHGMVVQHENQHDETMLATLQLRDGEPVLTGTDTAPAHPDSARLPRDLLIPGGDFAMGTSLDAWALDNERPAHRVHVPAFRLDTLPVGCGDYLAFVQAGGYDDPRHWTEAGWAWRCRSGQRAPMTWRQEGQTWVRTRFGRDEPVPLSEPVQHVCWYEASAWARWAGRRLPTEAEWEKAAGWDPASQRSRRYPWGDEEPTAAHATLGGSTLGPSPRGAHPAGSSAYGVRQLLGEVWEWTATRFEGYPGFRAYPYREYSEVFFGSDQYVLRGGSWATHPTVARATFRNWDLPQRRQIFAGFRTAVSVPEPG